jgi:membrane fusion protein (multidrug efflux system)
MPRFLSFIKYVIFGLRFFSLHKEYNKGRVDISETLDVLQKLEAADMTFAEQYMKSKRRAGTIAVIGIIAGYLVLAGCGKQSSAVTKGTPPPPEVGVITIQPQRVALTTELPGRTSAYLVAEVRPQVSGIIKKRLFTEGSDVKAGDVLYQIDPSTYQAAYNSGKAALARVQANLIPARLKAQRYGDLVKINAVSQQDYDDATAALKQAEADVEAAKATLETARINLAYTKVTAPISGRIGRSSVTDGALVTASQPAPLATIQQLSSMYVDVTQSSSELLRMKQALASGLLKGAGSAQTRVKLLLEDGSPYPLAGALKFSEVTVDQSTGSITLRAVFPNPKQTLLPGMFVRAVIEEGVNEHAILVPQRGVTRNPAGDAMVMVVGSGEKVEPRIIKVARTVGDNWLVSDGLKAGDRVILDGLQKARPGTPVRAVAFANKEDGAPAGAVKTAEATK